MEAMQMFRCRALLFDLDGTLIDSLPAVDRAWGQWASRNGFELEAILPKIHGRRSIDSIRELRPDVDAEAEDAWLRNLEATDTEGVTALPGALKFVQALSNVPFAYVTSGTSDVATARLRAVGLPIVSGSVYGEDVTKGKPAPDPFLLAADRLGVSPADCLAFEDTPAGVRAATAAGIRTIGIATWKTAEELAEAIAVVPSFASLSHQRDEERDEVVVLVHPT